MDLKQIEKFVDQLNDTRVGKTARCQGRLVPRDVLTRGMGGTTTLEYVCDDCLCIRKLEASSKNTPLANNDISLAAQVAFITTGCTYTTYANALQLLGIKPVNNHAFMKTLETLHPIVEAIVNAMCEREKQRMKDMNQEELGSWKRAVTCADGTWMTQGFHSKNATFSIWNYQTGALLYYMHICQKGQDKIIKEDLYRGTSKSAEGYGARELLKKAKKEGLNIEIH